MDFMVREGMDEISPNVDNLPRGNETILVVEDEPSMLELTQILLGRLGYRTIPAATGEEALRLFGNNTSKIGLVLTDIVLPGKVSGLEVARGVRESRPRVPICYMTAHANALARLEQRGENGRCLQKPFTVERLARLIRSAIDGAKTDVSTG